eukprot:TRINITY_DN48545_c0_g1_i1.p1 TRINITY_DN48545_c0_g1~~TRINITY_DN48545_c0_g1_i1.p1  ORF type:complete len:722 (+),score=79.09 TRINITY_DN48545_c0_g1_i1:87-2252(+)
MSVLIIGAGAAGIAAAKTLQELGRTVTILEGAPRIGGRTWTVELGGKNVDLGASWVEGHGCNAAGRMNPLTTLVHRYKMETGGRPGGRAVFWDTGKPVEHSFDSRAGNIFGQAWKQTMKQRTSCQVNDKSIGEVFEQQLGKRNDPPQVATLLAHHCSGIEQYNGAMLRNMSLKWYGCDGTFSGGDMLVQGYGATLRKHAESILPFVKLQHVVKAITMQDDNSVKVDAWNELEEKMVEFVVDKVIVTVSIGCLKANTIQFTPPLPEPKINSINKLGAGLMDKVVLHFEELFWWHNNRPLRSISFASPERGAWRSIYSFYDEPILVCLLAGDFAEKIETMTDEEVVADFLEHLRRAFGELPQLLDYKVTRWRSNPLTRCSYSYIPPGANLSDFDTIAEPVDNTIFFAGEATSSEDYACVHGAFISGEKAAGKVHKCLLSPKSQRVIAATTATTASSSTSEMQVETSDFTATNLAAQLRHNLEYFSPCFEDGDSIFDIAERGYASLIDQMPNPDQEALKQGSWKRLPIHWAAACGHAETVQKLIELGGTAQCDVHDDCHWTALDWAVQGGHTATVDVLTPFTSKSRQKITEPQTVALAGEDFFDVVERGLPDEVRRRIADASTSKVNARGAWARTPLMWACSRGHAEVTRILLENGADPTLGDEDGWTPLHWAVNNNHIDCATLLVNLDPKLSAVPTAATKLTPLQLVRSAAMVDALLQAFPPE